MGQKFNELSETHIEFILTQKLFFVGTATADSKVNISPKGMDSFRVINRNRIVWLNVTGSGNETAAHIQMNPRMTIMFTAFEGKPLTLRLYGKATAVHHTDEQWSELYGLFDPTTGARQIFDLDIDLVQSSCGMSIPLFDYVGERDQLSNWAEKKGEAGIREYWEDKNQFSLDGIATHIIDKNS
jgi:hypothetical protein